MPTPEMDRPIRFYPAQYPLKAFTQYYDIHRFIHHNNPRPDGSFHRYSRSEQLKQFDLSVVMKKSDKYAVSKRLMTEADIADWRVRCGDPLDTEQNAHVTIPPDSYSGDYCASVSSSISSTSLPLSSNAWRLKFCADEPFENEYKAALKQPFFIRIMDAIVAPKHRPYGSSGLASTVLCKLAAASWLSNPANLTWYIPPLPKRGITGTHAPFPMFWTQYYPQMKIVAAKACGVSISPQSWLPILKLVLAHLEFGGPRPFYADNPEDWMIGSGKSWSGSLIVQLKAMLLSPAEDKIDINTSPFTAEVFPCSFPVLTRTTGVEFAFGFKLSEQSNALCKALKGSDYDARIPAQIQTLLAPVPIGFPMANGFSSPPSSNLSVGSSHSSTRHSKSGSVYRETGK